MNIVRRIIQWTVFVIFTTGFFSILPEESIVISRLITKSQMFPAIIRISLVPVLLFLGTLLAGRIYCSILCPFATIQDLFIRRKQRFSYRKQKILKRYAVPLFSFSALMAGVPAIASIVDPYTLSGKIISTANQVILIPILNSIEFLLRQFSVYIISFPFNFRWITIISSIAILTVVYILCRTGGRLFCNTLCPVGALLSLPARWAFFSMRIRMDKCTGWGSCERLCKAEAIDSGSKTIDTSKCISCFNCRSTCKFDAITYGRKYKKPERPELLKKKSSMERKEFLRTIATGSFVLVSAPVLAKVKGPSRGRGKSTLPSVPPGAESRRHLFSKCTSCSLCISRCPGKVLEPSSFRQFGIFGLGIPSMNFNMGSCSYDCILCSVICPSGALKPLILEDKQKVKIGEARFLPENCIVETDKNSCGACGEICPTGAIDMVYTGEGINGPLELPRIDPGYCIGCGSCQFVCPVSAKNAIFVEGFSIHETAKIMEKKSPADISDGDNEFAF